MKEREICVGREKESDSIEHVWYISAYILISYHLPMLP